MTTTLPSVKARVRPTSPRLKPFVVEEPKDSKFTPPSADDIRTIYVPIENAINVPEHFDIRYCVHPSILISNSNIFTVINSNFQPRNLIRHHEEEQEQEPLEDADAHQPEAKAAQPEEGPRK